MTTPHDDTADQRDALLANLDAFTQGYIECALWSSTDASDDSGGDPLDANYGPEDLSLESLQGAINDCAAFQDEMKGTLYSAYHHASGYDAANAGHDLWLTRNGHGSGFWDRDLGAIGERLSKAAKAYGGVDLVVCGGVIEGC